MKTESQQEYRTKLDTFKQHEKFVYSLLWQYYPKLMQSSYKDDVEQAALLGFWRAIDTYDEDCQHTLGTHARFYMMDEINEVLRHAQTISITHENQKRKNFLKAEFLDFDKPAPNHTGDEFFEMEYEIKDFILDDSEFQSEVQVLNFWDKIDSILTPEEATVLFRVSEGEYIKDLAKEEGLTKKQMYYKYGKIVDKVKAFLKNEGK